MTKNRNKKKDYRTIEQIRQAERDEEALKAAFGSACLFANQMGWDWQWDRTDEKHPIMDVETPEGWKVCYNRQEFIKLVSDAWGKYNQK